MKTWFNKNSNHLIIIVLFIALVFFYFSPLWQGKTLVQSDVVQAAGSQKELFDYKKKDGDSPLWTNSMFGGMPVYQIWMEHKSNVTTYIGRTLRVIFPQPADVLFLYLIGGYLLFLSFRVKPWLAALGAVAVAFTSYNFIYIEAGHVNKAYAIAYMAPIIAGMILIYRKFYIWGAVVLSLFMALEIRSNHIQMTYYLFIALLVLFFIQMYHAIKQKDVKDFTKATAIQIASVLIAVIVNATVLFPTYEFSKLTIRGKSNIENKENSASGGLDRKYAYDWSQGVGENLTFMIPNAYGGASQGGLKTGSEVFKVLKGYGAGQLEAEQFAQSMPAYWGEKPFTSGPWYFGAGIIFLFVLGIFIVPGRYKWWIVGATILTVLLSFGRHFTFISDLFFDYFPMYNKFRAVESILVIPALLIPLLAILALNEITTNQRIKKLEKKILYSVSITGGVCLIVGLFPDLFLSFKPSNYQELIASLKQMANNQDFANTISNALVKDRISLARADAWRSLFIILLTSGAIWAFLKQKINLSVMLIVLAAVTLVDLWQVDKRYLNDKSFKTERSIESLMVNREVDQLIDMDKDLSYRVFDLSSNPFADARPSYFHKSLGGYHAAKLMRFQEIIENQFDGAINEDILDMFNVRYVITKNHQNNAERIERRSSAVGNAWFVNKVRIVNDNTAEMKALDSFDPKQEAIINQQFKDQTGKVGVVPNADIKLVSYHPDTMRYEYSSPSEALAVFSEVYYDKGWKAYLDGEELPILRADYILRALKLPGGNHKVEFVFAPESMKVSSILSIVGSILLVAGICFAFCWQYKKRKIDNLLRR